MISTKKNNLIIFEFYYFYLFLIKHFNFLFLINKIKMFNFNNLLINSKFFFFLNYNLINFKNLINYNVNKFLNFSINSKYNKFTTNLFNDNKSLKSFIFSPKKNTIEYKLFSLYFLFNYSLFNNNFKPHANIKMFSTYNYSNKLLIFDSSKFLIRWKEAYDLLFNIFFYNFTPLIFGTNFFKKEILALNWNYNNFDINMWKFYFPFFIFKLNNYNKKTDFFFDKLSFLNVNFFLISDCLFHFKTLHYIKKKNYYSVGLVNASLDPWIVTYPILTLFESFLTQLFFFKLLLFIEKQVLFFKYTHLKNTWILFLLIKSSQLLK